MANTDESGGVHALVRHTAAMAELAVQAGYPNRKHNEYLPYPDDNFNEVVDVDDEHLQRAGKFTIEHIRNRGEQTFVPNAQVRVKTIVAERIYAGFTEFLNPYLYCITTQYASFEWSVYKRYRHFHDLHKALVHFVETETKRSLSDLEKNSTDDITTGCEYTFLIDVYQSMEPMQNENQDYPRFPTKNDRMAFINDTIIQQRCAILIDYLNKVLKHPKFRKHSATCEFFEVSCLSFIYGVSISRKEGYLLKRSHDEYPGQRILFRLALFCDIFKRHHDRKWFVIKDSYVTYIRPNTHEVRFPMLVDRDFHILTGLRNVGAHHGIKIKNLQRTLVIKCRTSRDSDEWTQHLSNLIQQGKGFIDKTASRFVSFAPVRENQLAYWFVNGKSYMEAVARALLTAKEEVFITDWWLSPEIMLIRPTDDETFRLDNVLGRIADAGIRVYVMVFKEMSFAMGLNSAYTKRILTNKSKGGFIKVIRHPDHHPKGGVFLWSHHEKLVVIDQKIAFVGGIDLCYGRWDDDFMRLVDLGADNDTTLKSPFDIVAEKVAAGGTEIVESAQKATTQMAEQAGEKPIKSSDRLRTIFDVPNKASEDIKLDEPTQETRTEFQMKAVAKKWFESKFTDKPATSDQRKYYEDDEQRVLRRTAKYAQKWRKLAQ
ncbi:unnamed protein product, partial [Rotaria sordida]